MNTDERESTMVRLLESVLVIPARGRAEVDYLPADRTIGLALQPVGVSPWTKPPTVTTWSGTVAELAAALADLRPAMNDQPIAADDGTILDFAIQHAVLGTDDEAKARAELAELRRRAKAWSALAQKPVADEEPPKSVIISRDEIRAIGMSNPLVRYALMMLGSGLITWEQAMMFAVSMLAGSCKRMLDQVLQSQTQQPIELIIDGKKFRLKPEEENGAEL